MAVFWLFSISQFLFCWCSIPIVYCLSFLFSNSLIAFSITILLFFFSALVSVMCTGLLTLICNDSSAWLLCLYWRMMHEKLLTIFFWPYQVIRKSEWTMTHCIVAILTLITWLLLTLCCNVGIVPLRFYSYTTLLNEVQPCNNC